MARRTPSQLNMLLAVDKPVGCTSHDVVSQCRRALHERRVGHAGTLDPMASGVMVVGVGQATRLLGMLTLDTKSYVADISFGVETNTDDAEGEAVRTVPVAPELRDLAYARERLAAMLGPQMQVPPAFSAISVNGVRAYKSAREGNAVDLPPRPVEVYAADLIAVGGEGDTCVWTVAFSVSKGTYIRALARDLGRACDSAAHISALLRCCFHWRLSCGRGALCRVRGRLCSGSHRRPWCHACRFAGQSCRRPALWSPHSR